MIAKRITTIMLVFSIVLSLFTFSPVLSASAVSGSKVQILTDLGIYSEEDSMIYEEETLTREEVASILSVLFGVTERVYAIPTQFYDVGEYWASGHIATMVDHGIMGGYSDGMFRPKNYITVDEVIKIMITLTGYEPYAVYAGGYPNGYYSTALKYEFLDGVKIADRKAPVTKKVFSELLYNALHIPLLTLGEVNTINEVTYHTNKDVTLLTEKLNIYKVEGVLNATPYTTLDYSEVLGNDTIKIDNKLYKCYFDTTQYLATNVEGYYRQSFGEEIGEVIYLETNERKTEVITVESADIKNVTATKFTYADGKKTKSVDIPADVMVIYNGKRLADFDVKNLHPVQGYVRLIDADKNNRVESIVVVNEVNYLVETVLFENNKLIINDKNDKRPITVNLNDENVKLNIYNRGQVAEIKDIKQDMILSVMADRVDFTDNSVLEASTLYTINLSTDKIYGQLTSYDKEELTIEIDSATFGVEKELLETLVLGDSYNFYINHKNIVCGVTESTEFIYGILLRSSINEEDENKMMFDIFAQDSKKTRLNADNKLKIDGKLIKGTDNILYELKAASNAFVQTIDVTRPAGDKWATWQLIRYTKSGDKITQIDTIKPNVNPTVDDLVFSEKKISANLTWYAGLGSIANKIGLMNSVMFNLPYDKTQEDQYVASTVSTFYTQTGDFYFFSPGIMNRPKVFFKISESSNEVTNYDSDSTKAMLLNEIKYMRNDDGEFAPFMCGYLLRTANTYVEKELEDESLITDLGIKKGDFVKWSEDISGVVRSVEKSLSVVDGALTEDSVRATVTVPGGQYSLINFMSFGRAEAIDDLYIKMKYDSENPTYNYSGLALYKNALNNIYLYDSQSDTIEKVTINDIHTDELYGEGNGDMVAGYYTHSFMYAIVIYR